MGGEAELKGVESRGRLGYGLGWGGGEIDLEGDGVVGWGGKSDKLEGVGGLGKAEVIC